MKADFAKKRLAEVRLSERNRKTVEMFNAASGTKKVVDFGTGDGEFLNAYQEKHPEEVIIGFDPFSYTAEALSSIPEGVVVCDAAETGIYPDSVDMVTVNMPDPFQARKLVPRFIKEAWRILKPGGVIFIVFECPDFIFPVTRFTIHSSTTDIVSSLRGQGFQLEHEGVPLQEIDSHYPKTKTMKLCDARYGGCTLFKGRK
ncbi:MAG: methyltransferase domain-containing protein [Desulfobacterales bacterium]|nr:methyltransferase domain-containing protein [Desulfobacterales bacterium]